jgi:pteridine reductase
MDISSASLDGKWILITGAAKRIGAEITRTAHAHGANLAVHYRGSADAATRLAGELNAARPGSAIAIQADLLDTAHLPYLIGQIIDHAGRLDALVNNASNFYPTPVGRITEQDWSDLMGTNLKAPLFLAQAAAPHLRETEGAIVNIVDIHATRPLGDHPVYGAAKAGLAMLTRSLARDLAPAVRVNGVSPGAILWPDNDMSEATKNSIVKQVPLKRAGEPRDIAECVLFLIRDARYVTGQVIAVDGGRSVGW